MPGALKRGSEGRTTRGEDDERPRWVTPPLLLFSLAFGHPGYTETSHAAPRLTTADGPQPPPRPGGGGAGGVAPARGGGDGGGGLAGERQKHAAGRGLGRRRDRRAALPRRREPRDLGTH